MADPTSERAAELLAPERVERIAEIMGMFSAAHQALADYRRRRALGMRVAIFRHRDCLVVGPPPEGIEYDNQSATLPAGGAGDAKEEECGKDGA